MGNLMSALILFSTVVLSMGLGIGAAYGLVVGVLQAFGTRREVAAPAQRKIPVPVMIASENHASGD
jgi:hypothetical protein